MYLYWCKEDNPFFFFFEVLTNMYRILEYLQYMHGCRGWIINGSTVTSSWTSTINTAWLQTLHCETKLHECAGLTLNIEKCVCLLNRTDLTLQLCLVTSWNSAGDGSAQTHMVGLVLSRPVKRSNSLSVIELKCVALSTRNAGLVSATESSRVQ